MSGDTVNNEENASFGPSVGITQIPAVTTTKPPKRKAEATDETANKKGKVETNSPPSAEGDVGKSGKKSGKSGKSKSSRSKTDKTEKKPEKTSNPDKTDETDNKPPKTDKTDKTEKSTDKVANESEDNGDADDKSNNRLLVLKNVKHLLKTHDMRQSSEFVHALEAQIVTIINGAIGRAEANKRKTLQPHDI